MYTKIVVLTLFTGLLFTSCQKEIFTNAAEEMQDAERFSADYLALGFDTAQVCRLVLPKNEALQDTLTTRDKLWKGRTELSVSFLGGTPAIQVKILRYANEWAASTGITFQAVERAGDIRISFDEQSGSWAYIGTDALLVDWNEPTMNYAWLTDETAEEELKKIVLHEFGHALGLTHEQQHADKSINWNAQRAYVYYGSYPNYWTPAQVDAFVLQAKANTQLIYNPKDKASVMRYPIASALLHEADTTKANSALSASDKGLISLVYPTSANLNRLKSIKINNRN